MENIETIKESEFLEYYNSRTFNANCFNEDGSLNKNYNSFKSTSVIASIFEDHWENTYLANKDIIDKYSSKIKYTPGFFAFLHTFGRDLKWNPHIHILIAEIKLGNNNSCIDWKSFNVTFSYIGHDDNKYHEVTVSASQFIMILLRHLIPSQFKIIRYYGFYRKKHSLHPKMIPLIKQHCKNFRKSLLKHQANILLNFNRDPYNCPKCDTKMDFVLCIN